jgi:hypothetical protein
MSAPEVVQLPSSGGGHESGQLGAGEREAPTKWRIQRRGTSHSSRLLWLDLLLRLRLGGWMT